MKNITQILESDDATEIMNRASNILKNLDTFSSYIELVNIPDEEIQKIQKLVTKINKLSDLGDNSYYIYCTNKDDMLNFAKYCSNAVDNIIKAAGQDNKILEYHDKLFFKMFPATFALYQKYK